MYGRDGMRYQTQMGDLWRIGDHRVVCADIECMNIWEYLPSCTPAAIYTDPPWNAGNAKMFRNYAQAGPGAGYGVLLERLIEAGRHYACPMYLQWSVMGLDVIRAALGNANWNIVQEWSLSYHKDGDMRLILTFPSTMIDKGDKGPNCIMDGAAIRSVLNHYDRGVVIDPFLGLGSTMWVAHRLGWTCYGGEINPQKVSACLSRMSRQTGIAPVWCKNDRIRYAATL